MEIASSGGGLTSGSGDGQIDSICNCQEECIATPGATAFQYNDDGWCGCLQLAGTTFDQAVASREHIHATATECALCNIEQLADWQDPSRCTVGAAENEGGRTAPPPPPVQVPQCTPNSCHNDGHWVEVATPTVDGLCDCAEHCVSHPTATAFQFNAGGELVLIFHTCLELSICLCLMKKSWPITGFCGCLEIRGTSFADAISNHPEFIHPATHCTLCDIAHMAEAVGTNNELACQRETTVPSACAECFAPDGRTATCHSNTCQTASGHWVEVASGDEVADHLKPAK